MMDLARCLAERGRYSVAPNPLVGAVVARDGSVSAVTVIGGDSELARPVVDALRRERYEPARFRGRPVAVSIYRLISRMEVWGT